MQALNVSIAGAGFAGLAAGVLLARAGHRVHIHERFAEPQSIGAGILIQPTGLAALAALGLRDEVVARGAAIRSLYGVTPGGRGVVDLHYADWRSASFGLGLHRGVLFESLWNAAKAAGVEVHTNAPVNGLAQLTQAADLTIIADGAHSALRGETGLQIRHRDYPWGALWAVVPDPDGVFTRAGVLRQWYRRASTMLGVMPTGQRPGDGAPVVSLFWSLRADRLPAWHASGLDAWKHEVRTLTRDADAVLDLIRDASQLTWAHYADVSMPRYHAGHVVVIGDAAHATSPQLGQGTNMALLDALTLARCLETEGDVRRALERYTRERRAHLRYYGGASRMLTPLFQSDQRVLPWLRDVFMGPMSGWPVFKSANLQTLVGVRGGWLSGEDSRWIAEARSHTKP